MRSDLYILVGSEGRMWVDGEPSTRLDSVEDLTDLVMSRLEAGGTVVLDEFQRGYTLSSKVIRCAKVKVSKR